jgi:hypothetical protein
MRLVLEAEGVPWYTAKSVVDQAECGPAVACGMHGETLRNVRTMMTLMHTLYVDTIRKRRSCLRYDTYRTYSALVCSSVNTCRILA